MAKMQPTKPIKFNQFKQQLEEVGVNELQALQFGTGPDETIYLRLGVGIELDETEAFRSRVDQAESELEAATEILSHHPTLTAEEQLEIAHSHGATNSEIVAVWATATAEMRERMGKLRPRM